MSTFSPLLAAKADLSLLRFPLFASPKIDGIRAVVRDGVVYARSGKPIPNPHVQKLFGELDGLDGELVVGSPTAPDAFRQSQSGIMSKKGEPDVTFFVFDFVLNPMNPYRRRLSCLLWDQAHDELEPGVELVEQTMLYTRDQLDAYEAECLAAGYEGVMLRCPDAPYKFGRSTAREGILLKVKRFADAEAEVVGMVEEFTVDGQSKDTLGALIVRDLSTGVEFSIASGLTSSERSELWQDGNGLGEIIRYRHFPVGVKEKPRFPVFAGLRSALDMGVAHA